MTFTISVRQELLLGFMDWRPVVKWSACRRIRDQGEGGRFQGFMCFSFSWDPMKSYRKGSKNQFSPSFKNGSFCTLPKSWPKTNYIFKFTLISWNRIRFSSSSGGVFDLMNALKQNQCLKDSKHTENVLLAFILKHIFFIKILMVLKFEVICAKFPKVWV